MKCLRALGVFSTLAFAVAACASDAPSGKSDAPLVAADLKPPAGVTFQRIERPFGSLEVPAGAGWKLAADQVTAPDQTSITIYTANITPERLDELLDSYIEQQRHELPKYARTGHRKGTIGGDIAVRIEGSFDGGTKFITRDYLRFKFGKVVSISSRTPATNAAALPAIVDYVVASVQFK